MGSDTFTPCVGSDTFIPCVGSDTLFPVWNHYLFPVWAYIISCVESLTIPCVGIHHFLCGTATYTLGDARYIYTVGRYMDRYSVVYHMHILHLLCRVENPDTITLCRSSCANIVNHFHLNIVWDLWGLYSYFNCKTILTEIHIYMLLVQLYSLVFAIGSLYRLSNEPSQCQYTFNIRVYIWFHS